MGTTRRKSRRAPSRRTKRRSRRKRHPLRRALFRAIRWGLLFAVPAALIGMLWVDRTVMRRFEERVTTFPSRVYAAPPRLQRGRRLDSAVLEQELAGRGYRTVEREPVRPGEYQRRGNRWVIYLREAQTPSGPREATLVEVEAWWGKVRRLRDLSTHRAMDSVSLEPEPLFTFYAALQEERRWTTLDKIPRLLQDAVVTVEDRRFQRHLGVDPVGIARALWADVRAGRVVQGGSTVTQQLVKNLLGPGPRTIRRKMVEAVGAVALEFHLDKGQILEAYLNEVYLGQQGPVAISGVGEASRFYFGLSVQELDLPRSALLAGMIQNPGRYNPWRSPQEARERRDLVLTLMKRAGVIDSAAEQMARAAPLAVRRSSGEDDRDPWLQDALAREMGQLSPEALPSRAGFSMFTTISPRVQRAAVGALRDGLAHLEARLGRSGDPPLEGAVVVLRPDDGAVLALVGGRDFRRSQFNRALDARRPPGSTFKPFVYLAAFERTAVSPDFSFTAATMLEDSPLHVESGGKTWSPANYDRRFRGPVSARRALEESINIPTVRAALEVGPEAVVDVAARCGIQSRLAPLPSLALGTEEVTPLELAGAYATFANGGKRIEPHTLSGVIDREGSPVMSPSHAAVRVLDPGLAYLITNLLEGVMERGTGRSAAPLGFLGHAAGKTGSSDDLRDAWFVGYVPDLLALVWVGYDDNRPVGVPGAQAALPIWVDLMKRLGIEGDEEFPQPRGVVQVSIDPETGERAGRGCPLEGKEVFLAGTEPTEPCQLHGGRRRGFWRRLFDRD